MGKLSELKLLYGTPETPLKFWQRDGWTYASRKYVTYSEGNTKPDGVTVFGWTHDFEPRLLVTREFRKPLNTYIWALPAGLIDAGEDMYAAAAREVKEETGYDLVEIVKELTVVGFPSPGLTDECVANVFGFIDGQPSRAGLEGHEDIDTVLMSRDELKTLHLTGEPIDSKLAMIIAMLNANVPVVPTREGV